METDLYLNLAKNLVRGFNIQTLEFRDKTDKNGNPIGDIRITYLHGEVIHVPQDHVFSYEEREQILENINKIQEVGCYPQSDKPCELGVVSLN